MSQNINFENLVSSEQFYTAHIQ